MALALDDNKKKAFALVALAGLLGIGAVILLPKGNDTSSSSAPTTAVVSPTANPGAVIRTADAGEESGALPAGAAAAGDAGTGPVVVAAAPYRNDPFVPFFTDTLDPPPPPPTPRPTPRPAVIPLPADIPSPRGGYDEPSSYRLPGAGGAEQRTSALVGLPSARIPRLTNVPTAPRVQIAPPSVGGGSQPALERSPNKRLAGVVIGDSVRALLEVEDASAAGGSGSGGEFGDGAGQTPPKTYIVQPGQEIPEEGIRVLRIERTNEGGRSRVRMVVTENGVLRYIDLREGNTQIGSAGGSGGSGGGYPGSSGGGYPSSSGGGYPGGRGSSFGRGGTPNRE